MGDQLTNWPGNATKAQFLEMKGTKRRDLILQGACTASKIRGQPVSGGAHFFPDAIEKQPLLHWKPSLLMSSFQYFSTGLLRYNSQAIKFTALTYMTQRFLAYETPHYYFISNNYHTQKKLYIYLFLLLPQPLANSKLCPVPTYLPTLHISYKWNPMLCSLLCPV